MGACTQFRSGCMHIIATYKLLICGGAHSVMVIIVGNGHGDTSSNPG